MNKVGYKGKGESVWLAWFLATVLKAFIPICETKGDLDRTKKIYICYTKAKRFNREQRLGWRMV